MLALSIRIPIAALIICLSALPAFAGGYRIALGAGDDAIPVVVVSGTPREMGFAFGKLMQAEITAFVPAFMLGVQTIEPDRYGDAILDAAWAALAPHTSARIVEEMQGIAEGAGISFDLVRRAHMIPAVSEYACSGAAFWGSATQDGAFLQFRNLDYTMDGGLQDVPCIVIYLPTEGVAHMNITFAGVAGVNTGMNADGVVLTEMGDSPEDDQPYDLNGAHFTFMFRDILYDANGLDEALSIIQNARRIKKYHYIIGDGKNKKAVKILAHAPDLVLWRDNDERDECAPNIKEGVVYNFESRDPIGWAHINKYHGRYDMDAVIQLSKATGSLGGNLLNAVYDATNLEAWVAYAHKDESAYRRPYVHIQLKDYLLPAAPPEGAITLESLTQAPQAVPVAPTPPPAQ